MCNSNHECKTVRNHICSLPLEEHQAQVERCYFCLTHDNRKVNSGVVHKTDHHVRMSYVDKYYDFMSGIRRCQAGAALGM